MSMSNEVQIKLASVTLEDIRAIRGELDSESYFAPRDEDKKK